MLPQRKKLFATLDGGFTIIELLVVVSIIALIASSVFVLLSQARAKARDATREQHIKTLQTALDSYHTNARRYPICDINPPPANPPGDIVTGSDCMSVDIINADAIAVPPTDPLNQGNFRYRYYSASGADYVIIYYLESDGTPGKSAGQNQATP